MTEPASAGTDLKGAVDAFKRSLDYAKARKLLTQAAESSPSDVWIQQQLALATYKDEEMLPATRFARALKILEGIDLRDAANKDAETLALGGAIYKRMWEYDGQLEHLYEALAFYRAAHARNAIQDRGYGGVNAAYILQLLAARARAAAQRSSTIAVEADRFDTEAQQLLEQIAAELAQYAEADPSLQPQYWFVVTQAEVEFGLGHTTDESGRAHYAAAGRLLAAARQLEAAEWQRQTTFRQLVSIARLQGCELPPEQSQPASWHPAWQALANFFEDGADRALACLGKVGLALSGGGFRASFFHLGVLARLAEMDVLRNVEVLSTVSGGSIVGAHYYLEVQHLLQTQPDQKISRESFVEIVRRVQEQFLAGVQTNLRMRALASFRKCFKLIASKTYTRSDHMGELYEEELYARVADAKPRPRRMADLLVQPADSKPGEVFKPKFSNWRRRAKVPVLLLNTTSLNSGHLWHFTASWMGEPPGVVGAEVDANERYRRLYYGQAPTKALQDYRLGHAVAASACVPGLFEPLVIDGLYPGRVVHLVDGGVHDNQGVEGLLDEACTFVLCSDASGQMKDDENPAGGLLAPLLRSSQAIFMDRIREAEYQDLRGRVDSRALNGLFFVHLKQDLPSPPLDWEHCQDPSPPPSSETVTPYGVDHDVQRQLAAIRTDLDSFTEVEAYALMLSGYLMTEQKFKALQQQHVDGGEPGTVGSFDVEAPRRDWPFLALEPIVKLPARDTDPRRSDLGLQLSAGSSQFLKVWKLSQSLHRVRWLGIGAIGVLLVALVAGYCVLPQSVTTGGLLVIVAALAVEIWNWRVPKMAVNNILGKALFVLAGFVAAKVHLRLFDRLFVQRGQLKRLLALRADSSPAKGSAVAGHGSSQP